MRAIELELYQTFLNQNGHLSIVHKIEETYLHVMNYNGSLYQIRKDGNTQYGISTIDAQWFFENYPEDRINFDQKQYFCSIKEKFEKTQQKSKKLLLIL
jgi:hypothetical protein